MKRTHACSLVAVAVGLVVGGCSSSADDGASASGPDAGPRVAVDAASAQAGDDAGAESVDAGGIPTGTDGTDGAVATSGGDVYDPDGTCSFTLNGVVFTSQGLGTQAYLQDENGEFVNAFTCRAVGTDGSLGFAWGSFGRGADLWIAIDDAAETTFHAVSPQVTGTWTDVGDAIKLAFDSATFDRVQPDGGVSSTPLVIPFSTGHMQTTLLLRRFAQPQ